MTDIIADAPPGFAAGGDLPGLFAALAQAQAKFRDPTKDAHANLGSFKYAYATLPQVLQAVRPALAEHALALLQPVALEDGEVTVTSVIAHAGGGWISTRATMPVPRSDRMNAVQAVGSLVSYLRRYCVLGLLALGADDDDGQAAAPSPEPAPRAKPAPKPDPVLTEPQRKKLFAEIKKAGLSPERLKAELRLALGIDSTAAIPAGRLDWILNRVPAWAEAEKDERTRAEKTIEEDLAAARKLGWNGEGATLADIARMIETDGQRLIARAGHAEGDASREEEARGRDLITRAERLKEHVLVGFA